MMVKTKKRAPGNRTLVLTPDETRKLSVNLLRPSGKLSVKDISGKIMQGDTLEILDLLPDSFVDLLILDPPYNLDKNFRTSRFSRMSDEDYMAYLESWFPKMLRLLKPTASVYLCGDWKCSAAEYFVMNKYLKIRNRIIWQREKGRGAKDNWKNSCEDIWYATVGNHFCFDVESVKMKRKVIAPYRENGVPKDWVAEDNGNFRLTCPSNFWDDISIPYWSMPENTNHPTQKPEKLLAKLILASSKPGDFVFDPFLGSGTTAVAAKKLGRRFSGIELSEEYGCLGLRRLENAEKDTSIQGYVDGVFWERNTLNLQLKQKVRKARKKAF